MTRAYATDCAKAFATNAVVRAPGKETGYSVTEGAGAAASPEGDQLRSLATDRFTLSAAPRGAESRLWGLKGVVACGGEESKRSIMRMRSLRSDQTPPAGPARRGRK